MNCRDYTPSERMGRTRPICRYYQDGGTCSKPTYFLCVEWVAKKLDGKIVRVEERKDELT